MVEAERFAPAGYGVVCDANGVATLQDSYDHLRHAGKLVVYGVHTMMPKRGGTDWLAELMFDFTRWLKSGEIVPPPVAIYPMDEVGRAHADIESGRTVGKLVLDPYLRPVRACA